MSLYLLQSVIQKDVSQRQNLERNLQNNRTVISYYVSQRVDENQSIFIKKH